MAKSDQKPGSQSRHFPVVFLRRKSKGKGRARSIGTEEKASYLHGRQPRIRARQRASGCLHRRHSTGYQAAAQKY
jgi:hypothetical protein